MANKCPKCNADNPDTKQFCGDCGTQLPSFEDIEVTETIEAPKEELRRGTTFAGRYEIIEELGKGGMGRVYRVEDKKLEQEVALKLIKPEIAKDKKTIERFRNELKLARNIRHKNVCGMFDLGETEGAHFITMEYVRGEDLRSLIRRIGQLPIGKSISIAKEICEGLAEAHRLGVVHRDLKSNNIMVDNEGNVRIMDFGIARSLEAKGITGAGVMIGTPEYMSPEQVEGKETDQRSDIYSLGIILYEMVTGGVPFKGDTPFATGIKQKSEIPQNPKDINSQIPDDLTKAILKCLEKEKEKRFQKVGDVFSELESIEKGIPTTERIDSERKPLTSREITVQFSLKKLLLPVLAIIAIIIIGLILWQMLPKQKTVPITSSDKPSLAILYFENISKDEDLDSWRTGLSELLISDLIQSKYIDVLPGDRIFSLLKRLNLLDADKYTTEDLINVANEGGVSHTISGSFMKAGDNIVLTLLLQKPHTGEVIRSMKEECRGEGEILEKADELTKQIKSHLNLTQEQIAGDIDKELGKITTSSPEAFKYYAQARKYLLDGNMYEAISLLNKALEIDPEFASGYDMLANSLGNIGHPLEAKKYGQMAFDLRDRVAERERYRIEGTYYSRSEKTYPEAIESFQKLLDLSPDDTTGNNMLGIIYRNIGELDKAIELHKVNVEKNRTAGFVYHFNLVFDYCAKGLFDQAIKVVENYQKDFDDIADASIHLTLSLIYNYQGKHNLALSEVEKAFSLSPRNPFIPRQRGCAHYYLGNLTEANKDFQYIFEKGAPTIGVSGLAAVYVLQGKFKEAKNHLHNAIQLAEKKGDMVLKAVHQLYLGRILLKIRDVEEAMEMCEAANNTALEADLLNYQRESSLLKGYLLAEMNSLDLAQEVAAEFKALAENRLQRQYMKYYFYLMGNIFIKEGNLPGAIEYINNGLSMEMFGPLSKPAYEINNLATAYLGLDDIKRAQDEYRRITSLIDGRLTDGDIYAKSFYMLGKINEKQGDTAKAIENYEKFLSLWKDADPGIAEVEEAKKRLAGLKGN